MAGICIHRPQSARSFHLCLPETACLVSPPHACPGILRTVSVGVEQNSTGRVVKIKQGRYGTVLESIHGPIQVLSMDVSLASCHAVPVHLQSDPSAELHSSLLPALYPVKRKKILLQNILKRSYKHIQVYPGDKSHMPLCWCDGPFSSPKTDVVTHSRESCQDV